MSNIQSYQGRVADSVGGQVQRVSPNGTATIQQALDSYRQANQDYLQNWTTNIKNLQERLATVGGPLNKQFREELSSGFITSRLAASHYGTASLQPTVGAVYTGKWSLPTRPRDEFEVLNKPNQGSAGEPTYGWPGYTRGNELDVPRATPLADRIRAAMTQSPPELQSDKVSFSTVFSTLKSESDE